MKFIARAGAFIDRSHRVAGFFLISTILLCFTVISMSKSNAQLADEVERISRSSQVYVIPGSQAGFYSPSQAELLLQNFGQYIVQALNTYTYTSLEPQFFEVQKFFTPDMLLNAKVFYQRRIQESRQDEHASLFVPEINTLKIIEVPAPVGDRTDASYYQYSIQGIRQDIIGAQVIGGQIIHVFLTVRQAPVSKTNPWGFVLSKYREEQL